MDAVPPDQPTPPHDPYRPPAAPIGRDRERSDPPPPASPPRRSPIRARALLASALVLAAGIALLTICAPR